VFSTTDVLAYPPGQLRGLRPLLEEKAWEYSTHWMNSSHS